MKNLLFAIITILFFSCNTNPTDSTIDMETSSTNIKIPTVDIDTNTLLVKTKCAVIPNYSSAEIDSIRKEAGEDNFAEIISDIAYYKDLSDMNCQVTLLGI